jgi:diphosphomevalonate decarboxylase
MQNRRATAVSCANIALVKYWGNRDDDLRLPANGSLSMNLAGLETITTVELVPELKEDEFYLNGEPGTGPARERVSAHLDRLRQKAGLSLRARVESRNNFPMGVGIASSASAYAALTLAGARAAALSLSERELSAFARLGSGSACRSIPAGFVEWQASESPEDSYAFSIAPPSHWALADVIAVVSQVHKAVSSTAGHALAKTSPLHAALVASAPERLQRCREALLARRMADLADVVEADSNLMHAVMMTSTPPLFYWEAGTLEVMKAVRAWRASGLPVCYTVDAGPNVHCLCLAEAAPEVERRLRAELSVNTVFTATPGGGARVL